jgi:hypothetical protein
MTKDQLVATIKQIAILARSGDLDGAHKGYKKLFEDASFTQQRPEDQRQALKLMVLAKRIGHKDTPAIVDAHRAAVGPLTELVSLHNEPADYEMLGVCHVLLGNNDSAARIFKEAIQIERGRNAGSDLCGSLMSRLSAL